MYKKTYYISDRRGKKHKEVVLISLRCETFDDAQYNIIIIRVHRACGGTTGGGKAASKSNFGEVSPTLKCCTSFTHRHQCHHQHRHQRFPQLLHYIHTTASLWSVAPSFFTLHHPLVFIIIIILRRKDYQCRSTSSTSSSSTCNWHPRPKSNSNGVKLLQQRRWCTNKHNAQNTLMLTTKKNKRNKLAKVRRHASRISFGSKNLGSINQPS